ncbi:hypothetical protein B0T24DRAFT_222875 [Lasiosphaeria ovina]|uniref:Uncharacterized protein n=1 Tax=Lasiosphaeria ovina TaxID=92902 RepID=A0AAE0KH37_9PEZI|nr:hypothetical protein B0T24DRAFT_222875 [Lasiosphaeria ovina]
MLVPWLPSLRRLLPSLPMPPSPWRRSEMVTDMDIDTAKVATEMITRAKAKMTSPRETFLPIERELPQGARSAEVVAAVADMDTAAVVEVRRQELKVVMETITRARAKATGRVKAQAMGRVKAQRRRGLTTIKSYARVSLPPVPTTRTAGAHRRPHPQLWLHPQLRHHPLPRARAQLPLALVVMARQRAMERQQVTARPLLAGTSESVILTTRSVRGLIEDGECSNGSGLSDIFPQFCAPGLFIEMPVCNDLRCWRPGAFSFFNLCIVGTTT